MTLGVTSYSKYVIHQRIKLFHGLIRVKASSYLHASIKTTRFFYPPPTPLPRSLPLALRSQRFLPAHKIVEYAQITTCVLIWAYLVVLYFWFWSGSVVVCVGAHMPLDLGICVFFVYW